MAFGFGVVLFIAACFLGAFLYATQSFIGAGAIFGLQVFTIYLICLFRMRDRKAEKKNKEEDEKGVEKKEKS